MPLESQNITAHNFSKISLLEACNAQHKFDMMGISKKYLDSSFPDDDPRLNLPGDHLDRTDDLNSTKQCLC